MFAYVVLICITVCSHLIFKYRARRSNGRINHYSYTEDSVALRNERIEAKTITVFFVIYIFLLGLRDSSVGIDTNSYLNYFSRLQFQDWKGVFDTTADEFGFALLTKFIGSIAKSPQFYLMVLAVVSVGPLAYFYRKESKDALLCFSFFLISLLFEAFFSALREGVALGLVVPAYYFTKKKKIVPFILIVLLASTFHLSALILVALYPIYHAKITLKWLWVVAPLMFIIYRYNAIIFNALLVNMGGKYANKYLIYGYNASGQYGLLILFVLISVYCFVMMDEEKADADDIGLRNLLLLATALQLFAPLHVLASRINYYFIVFIPVALTRVNSKCKHMFWQVAKLAKYVMIIYFIFYFFFMKGDALQIMNYSFAF